MTDLRDARFKKALDAAPDADARPPVAMAQAIRAAARTALPVVPQTARASWWQKLWQSTAIPHAPWNAAFATLLVGVLVTVLWVREPIPDARPPAPTSAPAPAPVASPSPIATPATSDAVVLDKRAIAASPVEAPPATTSPAARPQAPIAAPPPTNTAQRAEPSADQPPVSAKASAGMAAEEHARSSRMQKEAPAGLEAQSSRAPAPSANAPAAAAPMVVKPVAPAASAQDANPLAPLEAWTALRVEGEGGVTTLGRAQGQRLFERMVQLLRPLPRASLPTSATPTAEPSLRLSVMSQGQTLAELRVWDGTALWQQAGQPDVLASVPAAEVQALLQQARQAVALVPQN